MKQWQFNLNKSKIDLPEPYGFIKVTQQESIEESKSKQMDMKMIANKKLMEISVGGLSQIFMSMFMFWMMGSSLNLFTIMFIMNFTLTPIKAIMNVNQIYKQFEDQKIDLLYYKSIYCAVQSVSIAIGLYKLYGMGLLPLAAYDWIDLVPKYQSQNIAINLNE